MKTSHPYKLGIRGLSLVVFFRLLLLLFLYYQVNSVSIVNYKLPITKIFNRLEIAMLVLVIIEAFTYGWLQNRIQNTVWVRLHVWCLAFVLIVMPAVMMGVIFIIQHLNKEESAAILKTITRLKFYLGWTLTIAGHSAFIVVLVKSVKKKIEAAPIPEPGGLLDEFATE